MPDTTHADYDKYLPDWVLLETLQEGEKAIKEAGELYLPMLGGQDSTEYAAYKNRGEFYNAFARTVQGLTGSMFRKDTEVKGSDKLIGMLPTITTENTSWAGFSKTVGTAVIKKGRCGVLIDKDGNKNSAYTAFYEAESIINWSTAMINGKMSLTMIALREDFSEITEGSQEAKKVEQIRIMRLKNETLPDKRNRNYVEVIVYTKKESEDSFLESASIFPKIGNAKIEEIPFVFFNPCDQKPAPDKAPLLDLAYINLSHWRKSVDLAHGLHFTALPTPWAAGFDRKEKLHIGPTTAWISDDPTATCGYLEFSGAGLRSIEVALDRNEKQMAMLGSRMIEKTRDMVETAETAKIRQAGETSSLASIGKTLSLGLTDVLVWVCKWESIPYEDVTVTVNDDFVEAGLSPQELTAFTTALQSGSISKVTYLYNLKRGELLPPETTIQEEIDLIDLEGSFGEKEFDKETDSNGEGGDN